MPKPVKGSRRYDASRRQAAAAATRRAILEAARELFLTRGYASTTMPEIASRAGVALDTVYAAAGRKPAIFRELIETAISGQDQAVPSEERDYVQAIQAEPDAARKLEIYAAALTRIQVRLAPLLAVVQAAAHADPELAGLWRAIGERRAERMTSLAGVLEATGRLAVPAAQAADFIWATNSSEFFLLLTRDRGWSEGLFESWLARTWKEVLLAPPG